MGKPSKPMQRFALTSDGKTRAILDALRAQGWRVEQGRKSCHLRCVPPDPTLPIVVHSSSPKGGNRGDRNWIAQLRRSGFVWKG